MKENWLHPRDIKIIQPQTPEEVDALADDIMTLIKQMPRYDEDFVEGIREFPHYLKLIYHNNKPVAYIQIEDNEGYEHLGKDSLEFSGAVLPEYREAGITMLVSPVVIRKAFIKTGKKKMLASIHPDNKEARMAISALGFRHIGKDHNRNLLYRLNRKDAIVQ